MTNRGLRVILFNLLKIKTLIFFLLPLYFSLDFCSTLKPFTLSSYFVRPSGVFALPMTSESAFEVTTE